MQRRNGVYALLWMGMARAAAAAPDPGPPQEALMEVTVNGEKQPAWSLLEVATDGAVSVRRGDLESWGIQLGDTSPLAKLEPDARVRLTEVVGVQAVLNPALSQLDVSVLPSLLRRHRFDDGTSDPAPTPSPPGAFVNYDLSAFQVSGLDQLRVAAEAGMVYGNWIARSTALGIDSPDDHRSLRLESNLTADFPGSRTSLQVGDSFARLGTGGEPVRIAGLSWGTDFSVTPQFITVPLPTVNNLTAAAGTVELLVNGTKTQQLNVPGGPFTITQVPVTTGAGELTVITRDLLGRTQVITQSYYVSPQMLQAGLAAWDLQFGAKRQDYGLVSNDYSGWVAAGGERVGLTNRLTAQWRVEADETGGAVGGQLLALGPADALFTASSSCSAVTGRLGCLAGAGYEHDVVRGGYGVDLSYATARYLPVAAPERALPPRWQAFAHAQADAGNGVNVTAGGTWRESIDGTHSLALNVDAGKTFFGRGHLDLAVSRLWGSLRSSYVSLTYTQSLGRDRSASATAYSSEGRAGESVTLEKNIPIGQGYGYTLRAARDSVDGGAASGQWNGNDVSVAAIAQRLGTQSETALDVSGAALWMGGAVHLARRLDESFAIVHADGLPGLPIFLDQQPIATLDGGGTAVIPDLRPFQLNQLSLDPTQIPLSLDVSQTRFDAVPYRRGGVWVEVPVHLAAPIRLRLDDGDFVPAGARIRRGVGSAPVGARGIAYFEGVRGDNVVDVEWPEGHCRAHLTLPVAPRTNPLDDTVDLRCSAR